VSKLSFPINDALLDQAFFFVNQEVAESVERLFFFTYLRSLKNKLRM